MYEVFQINQRSYESGVGTQRWNQEETDSLIEVIIVIEIYTYQINNAKEIYQSL